MLLAWVLERSHGQVEDVTSHFPVLRHWVEATELNGLNALLVIELVEIALEDTTLDEITDVAHDFLSCRPFISLGKRDDFVALVRPNYLVKLIVALFHPFILVKELLGGLRCLFLFGTIRVNDRI